MNYEMICKRPPCMAPSLVYFVCDVIFIISDALQRSICIDDDALLGAPLLRSAALLHHQNIDCIVISSLHSPLRMYRENRFDIATFCKLNISAGTATPLNCRLTVFYWFDPNAKNRSGLQQYTALLDCVFVCHRVVSVSFSLSLPRRQPLALIISMCFATRKEGHRDLEPAKVARENREKTEKWQWQKRFSRAVGLPENHFRFFIRFN